GNVLAGMGSGGGISNNGGDFRMVNCKIWGNHARADGAGMNNGGIAVLENCEFYDNHAGWSSGAINNGGQLTVISCYLHDNTARIYGGAIDNTDGGKLTLINSRITNNRNSGWMGGGVSNHVAGSTVTGDPAQVYGNTPNDRWGW
ncbi:MAG: hypothetical protein LUQ08_05865, partial [Methanothrix sp.]|nr:hypothetical protein [Methanothrix sp.]